MNPLKLIISPQQNKGKENHLPIFSKMLSLFLMRNLYLYMWYSFCSQIGSMYYKMKPLTPHQSCQIYRYQQQFKLDTAWIHSVLSHQTETFSQWLSVSPQETIVWIVLVTPWPVLCTMNRNMAEWFVWQGLTHLGLVALCRHWSGSTLAQVMACCLMAPSHYLNQSWLITIKVQWHSSDDSFMKDAPAINHWH